MREFAYKLRPLQERESFREYAELCAIEPQLAPLLIDA
jgi:hypothetical protein